MVFATGEQLSDEQYLVVKKWKDKKLSRINVAINFAQVTSLKPDKNHISNRSPNHKHKHNPYP